MILSISIDNGVRLQEFRAATVIMDQIFGENCAVACIFLRLADQQDHF
jgi:hypothetical protein